MSAAAKGWDSSHLFPRTCNNPRGYDDTDHPILAVEESSNPIRVLVADLREVAGAYERSNPALYRLLTRAARAIEVLS